MAPALLGARIREIRRARGWSLAELARRAGTSAPALHRYESGWDRFGVPTLRRIADALGARLEVRLIVDEKRDVPRHGPRRLVELLSPLFWDKDLTVEDLERFPTWVLGRLLAFGNLEQVRAARRHFGDDAVREAIERRDVDARTRNFWTLMLDGGADAP
ncbi:MAG: helix-turn-helix domain-containing protein [Planctomycetota bacterium]|jgi:transcriptional regulator with XRE-family HTH domain